MEDLVSGCAPKGVSGTTMTASTSWLESSWLEHYTDQEVLKVLWSVVGYQGPPRDGFYQMVGGM